MTHGASRGLLTKLVGATTTPSPPVSEPSGVGADKGTGGGSHNHRFYPPEAAKAMVPGLKIKAKGLTTGQALSVLVQMFEE